MTYARDQIHNRSGCGVEARDSCNSLDDLLDWVEDDRAHAEAEKLREQGEEMRRNGKPHGMTTMEFVNGGALITAARAMDPYELRDGWWVHKTSGRVMVSRKANKETS